MILKLHKEQYGNVYIKPMPVAYVPSDKAEGYNYYRSCDRRVGPYGNKV